ncbi:MAG: hypothetical protein ACPG5B_17300 [Chitinophagales bacterium]
MGTISRDVENAEQNHFLNLYALVTEIGRQIIKQPRLAEEVARAMNLY